VLVAIAVTVRIANQQSTDSARADVRNIAQIQLEDLAPDRAAAERGLGASVLVDAQLGTIEITPNPTLSEGAALVLEMLHPLDATLDRRILLLADGGSWRGQTRRFDAQTWLLRLGAEDGSWRLRGRLARDQTRTELLPAVGSDG
jgi:hypothetical protein